MSPLATFSDDTSVSNDGALILVVENDVNFQHVLAESLRPYGYRVVFVAGGAEGLLESKTRNPDLIVLDLGLPDMEGLEFMARVREWSQAPIIVISARGHEHDKVLALDHGADDYLTKPFGMQEFLARLRLSLRRTSHQQTAWAAKPFRTGDLVIDLHTRKVSLAEKPVRLTPTEYKILAVLVHNAGTVVPGRTLLSQVWGPQCVEQDQYLRVYMVHLRRKVEPAPGAPRYVLTEPGVGYRLEVLP